MLHAQVAVLELLLVHVCLLAQVKALAELLPDIEVVKGDQFNSHPTDTKLMGPDALERFRRGEKLPAVTMRTPLASSPDLGFVMDSLSSNPMSCVGAPVADMLHTGLVALPP
jgi:hypothetical protein